jgi:hypothetical protein
VKRFAADAGTPNRMQRVFDVLAASASSGVTVDELVIATMLTVEAVDGALHRLRKCRAVSALCVDRVWRYRLRAGAERP